jgi:hypothetical protein
MLNKPVANSEDAETTPPLVSGLLAYLAMAPLIVDAPASLVAGPFLANPLVHLGIIWSAALLCFFSGVRRGLSFRQAGGPRLSQLITMAWLFILGVGALLIPVPILALAMLELGFASVWLLDPIAARHNEVPRYFRWLRQKQMLLPMGTTIVLITKCLAGPL